MENTEKFKIVSCSGASNTGKYADEVARRLEENGDAEMVCLAKIAIQNKPLIDKLKALQTKIVVLDGCPINCAEKILGKEGLTNIIHINTTNFDIVKGKTPLTDDKINEIMMYIKKVVKENSQVKIN